MSSPGGNPAPRRNTIDIVRGGLKRRYRRERRFRLYGIASVLVALASLALLFADIVSKGWQAFEQTQLQLEVHYDPEVLGIAPGASDEALAAADYEGVLKQTLLARFPGVMARAQKRELFRLLSAGAGYELRERLMAQPALLGRTETLWLVAHGKVDAYVKETGRIGDPPATGISAQQAAWLGQLDGAGQLELRLNRNLLGNGDSRDPELAGIRGAVMGSLYTLAVTLLLSFPLGVAAAIYLEEFAPRNRWTDLIEVNINNLAAVPSIVFGLLGLAVFINLFGMPRSAPLVGGLVLTLVTFPTVIIASRAAIRAVPPSLREAALGLGASRVQMVLHHVLPNALPGMLTGAIIGMARALGETAPLLMIGMVAFIVDVPRSLTDSATVLPVQIYLWADSPERGFTALTSAAIMVLLGFLVIMNALAVFLRNRFEKRW
ncbi:MAG: phosphate ABC transporter permease PstA [Gammaproteobacteria bacterium]|nr:phosphate ABC transporter permease PstA [Gammaproteobacteria bacterium]